MKTINKNTKFYLAPGATLNRRRGLARDIFPEVVEVAISTASEYSGIHRSAILGRSRKREISIPRQAAMFAIYQCRQKHFPYKTMDRWSLASIGGVFDRDHATVIHTVKAYSDYLDLEYFDECKILGAINSALAKHFEYNPVD